MILVLVGVVFFVLGGSAIPVLIGFGVMFLVLFLMAMSRDDLDD